ncbi:biotin carboxyl carrier protein [Magnetococcus marinus MC-1]|uniref:Biotin carboxyl carrier protein of acetyl-CoA carboxylase n=1 Tax=Magnetococcus marinus (strain ATCC BAA-1437 / JCM 17883 / MC-1) TaxID=156889 RepID=A0L5E5_MAGMM|nr:acetyl-CoA carboxylase biotin carboxyl carrier protein [Magnetococcus marinus]ABK43188.1 biotin carboxyl carrier protein [Magnetococcus marinus MC-1]
MDLKEIRQLIKMLDDTDVSEIEVCQEGSTVRISRGIQPTYMTAPPQHYMAPPQHYMAQAPGYHGAPAAAPALATAETSSDRGNAVVVTSPMVGTFYKSPSPDAAAFVKEGEMVEKGQVLCIIEAMKLMNEIESEHSGRLVKILVDNASPVEFGEELFLIEPV